MSGPSESKIHDIMCEFYSFSVRNPGINLSPKYSKSSALDIVNSELNGYRMRIRNLECEIKNLKIDIEELEKEKFEKEKLENEKSMVGE